MTPIDAGHQKLAFSCTVCLFAVKDPGLLWKHVEAHNAQRQQELIADQEQEHGTPGGAERITWRN